MGTIDTTNLTEQERTDSRNALSASLEDIDRAQMSAHAALMRVRAVRQEAESLLATEARTVTVVTYDLDMPGDRPRATSDLGMSAPAQTILAGRYREPVRELVDATWAAEARLLAFDQTCDEDRAKVEADLARL